LTITFTSISGLCMAVNIIRGPKNRPDGTAQYRF
jgi:hypothetical protein